MNGAAQLHKLRQRVVSMVIRTICLIVVLVLALQSAVAGESDAKSTGYYPGRFDWETRDPKDLGMDATLLDKAVAFAKAHETTGPVDLDIAIRTSISSQPHDELIGPTKPRGSMNGIVLRHGYIVAEWGDTRRVDMTFSATKSYLSTMAGLAWDKQLIRNLDDPVKLYVPDDLFVSEHNGKITWHMLLNQTSEWEGLLWDKPDWAPVWDGKMRELHEPGSHWQYNDVRVNCLALALLHVWRRPLPQVLREQIMEPIDASPTWRWHGYRNSWVDIDGLRMQSVSGGGHWGGGLWINTRDHARFGYLFLRRGRWKVRQLISEQWVQRMTTPTEVKPTYGYMWWLNANKERNPDVPANSFAAVGAGTNLVWVDPEHDIVVVVRWIDPKHDQEFLKLVVAAIVAEK